MTGNTISISRGAAITSALGLVILGAAGTFGWIRGGRDVAPRQATEAAAAHPLAELGLDTGHPSRDQR